MYFFDELFWLSVLILTYIYAGYPLIVYILGHVLNKPLPKKSADSLHSITILVPAHNEDAVIEQKIQNLLAIDYPKEHYDILVVSDGSVDDTNKIAESYASRYPDNVRFFLVEDRKGKTNAINKSIKTVQSDITVFTDANVFLDQDALKNLNRDFCDQNIGGVAGQLSYTNEDAGDAAASNGLYWRYEEAIKNAESKTGSIMGADGSIFAIRTSLYNQLPVHVLDDFCTSMGVILQGYKFRFDHSVKAFEKGAETSAEEFPRKVRISNRSYNSYRYLRPWSHLDWLNRWKFFSHKWLRWHSITIMLIAFFSSLASVLVSPSLLMSLAVMAQLITYGLVYIKHIKPDFSLPLLGTLYYFVSSNVACGIGIVQSLRGTKTTIWSKAASTR